MESPQAQLQPVCPWCLSPVHPESSKCASCGANVGDAKPCPSCAEPVRARASVCPFCGADLRPPLAETAELVAEPWVVYASAFGSFITEQLPTGLLFPPCLTITDKEIRITRKMLLGLRTVEHKLSISRVASVRAQQGVFWAGITIETYGGASGDLSISGLDKEEARETAALLDRIARANERRQGDQ